MIESFLFNSKVYVKRKSIVKLLMVIPLLAAIITISFYISNQDLIRSGNQIYSYFFFDAQKRSVLNSFLVTLPLLITFIFGDVNYYEKPVISRILVRNGNRYSYYITNAILAFLAGFFVILLFLCCMFVFNFIITYHPEHTLTSSSIATNEIQLEGAYFAELFLNNPYLDVAIQTMLLSLYGGFLSLTTYTISLFCKAKLITYLSTMCISLVSMFVFWVIGYPFINWNLQMIFSPQLVMISYHIWGIGFWIILFIVSNILLLTFKIKLGEDA